MACPFVLELCLDALSAPAALLAGYSSATGKMLLRAPKRDDLASLFPPRLSACPIFSFLVFR